VNLAQIVRLGLLEARAVKQSGSLVPSVSTSELYAWANDANLQVEQRLRAVADDYFVRRLNSSSDTTAQKIMGVSYTPSTSLQLAASTRAFSLPPDFLSLRSIRCVSSGYEDTHFYQMDLTHARFQSMLRDTAEAAPGEDLYYDIQGERTLYLAQPVSSALDIEIAYVARTKKLTVYQTGTIAVTTGTTAVTGSSTTWSSGTPFDTAYLDIHYGTSGSATVPTADPSTEYDDVNRARVSSITTDTALVVATNRVGTLASGTGYLLASVPVVPEDFHAGLAAYVAGMILLGDGNPKAAGHFQRFEAAKSGRAEPLRRQAAQVETVEAWSPWED